MMMTDLATASRTVSRRGNRVTPGESHPRSAPHRPPNCLFAPPGHATSLMCLSLSVPPPVSAATSALSPHCRPHPPPQLPCQHCAPHRPLPPPHWLRHQHCPHLCQLNCHVDTINPHQTPPKKPTGTLFDNRAHFKTHWHLFRQLAPFQHPTVTTMPI